MVVLAFFCCVVFCVDMVYEMKPESVLKCLVVGNNVNRTAAHGILRCYQDVACYIVRCEEVGSVPVTIYSLIYVS